jgi:hypothetical protein
LLASVALAAVFVGVAFAAFGGTSSRVVDPVAEAATVSSTAPGYQMRFSIEVASPGTSTPITATGEGTFDLRDQSGSMSVMTQALGSESLNLQEILNGSTVYLKLPAGAASELPTSGKQWLAVNLAKLKGIPGLSSLVGNPVSSDPSQILEYLRAVSDSIVADGHQQVDGVETTHYRADLSLDRIADALPSADQPAAQQALSTLEQSVQLQVLPVDVWVDAHHLVRRVEMTIAIGAPDEQTDEELTIDVVHYGPEPPPVLPPADEVASLNGLVGAAG